MEIFSKSMSGGLGRYWRRRSYRRLDGATGNHKNVKIVRLGGRPGRRSWRVKAIPKLRLKITSVPMKLWSTFKTAYVNMMLNLAGNVGVLSSGNVFGGKRISVTPTDEFENRLVYEIYKALMASKELGSTTWNE